VLEFSEGAEGFELGVMLVPGEHRGTGLGSLLLERLLVLADSLGKPVHTQARPIGSSTPETLARLVRYYERWGFEPRQRGVTSVMMTRPPRTPPRS
jgi:GNAT superfamily N-acetyltransferase